MGHINVTAPFVDLIEGDKSMRNYYESPVLVDISVTNRCNLNCEYCSAESGPFASKKGEMDLETLASVFSQLDRLNVPRVAITGGEPLIREDIIELLTLFDNYSFAKVLNTNGNLLNKKIAREISKLNLDRICVTVDGSTSEIHDSARGKGSFKKAIAGIKHLQYYNLPVSTLFTLGKHNVNDLIRTIQLMDKLEVAYLSVMVLCPTGRANDGSALADEKEWYKTFLELSEKIKNREFKTIVKIVPPNESDVFWTHYFPLEYYNRLDLLSVWGLSLKEYEQERKREISCQAGVKACSIFHQGDVYGCDLMNGIEELIAGNVKSQCFSDIWNNSEVFKKFREIEFDKLTGKCAVCPHEWCGGGCRLSALEMEGSLYGSDSACFFKEVQM
jgi:radical SAM protein with 4Fe4S-binding SPASM domain